MHTYYTKRPLHGHHTRTAIITVAAAVTFCPLAVSVSVNKFACRSVPPCSAPPCGSLLLCGSTLTLLPSALIFHLPATWAHVTASAALVSATTTLPLHANDVAVAVNGSELSGLVALLALLVACADECFQHHDLRTLRALSTDLHLSRRSYPCNHTAPELVFVACAPHALLPHGRGGLDVVETVFAQTLQPSRLSSCFETGFACV